MKGNGLKFRRAHFFSLAVLALAATVVLVSTYESSAQEDPQYCITHGHHEFEVDGGGSFMAPTVESIAAEGEPMKRFVDRNGLSTLPISVKGMAGRGYAEGVGETVYWLDKSRPVAGSMIRAKARGTHFPAVQEMHFHLLLTTEALPGRTLRSINPAIMVNNNARSFPPKAGSHYVLRDVVEMEDVDHPGPVVLRIVSNRNQIVGGGRPDFVPDRRHLEN